MQKVSEILNEVISFITNHQYDNTVRDNLESWPEIDELFKINQNQLVVDLLEDVLDTEKDSNKLRSDFYE